jgi:hypothetical protein
MPPRRRAKKARHRALATRAMGAGSGTAATTNGLLAVPVSLGPVVTSEVVVFVVGKKLESPCICARESVLVKPNPERLAPAASGAVEVENRIAKPSPTPPPVMVSVNPVGVCTVSGDVAR